MNLGYIKLEINVNIYHFANIIMRRQALAVLIYDDDICIAYSNFVLILNVYDYRKHCVLQVLILYKCT